MMAERRVGVAESGRGGEWGGAGGAVFDPAET